MKSIKYKILVSFCLTAAMSIILLAIVISLQLNVSIEKHSAMLSDDLFALINTTLEGYYKVFERTIYGTMDRLERLAINITRHPGLVINLESYQVNALTGILDEFRARNTAMDFVILFDLQGYHLASSPSDINDNVDVMWLRTFYQSWDLGQRARESLSTGSEELLFAVTAHETDFIEALNLTDRNFSGDTFISVASANIVTDDFQEPLAVLIVGKILNNYSTPLQEFYQMTGLGSVVYAGTTPIAHIGFHGEEGKNEPVEDLRIPQELVTEVYGSETLKHASLLLANTPYLITCSAMTDSAGKNIGMLGVGMPRQQVMDITQHMLSYGTQIKTSLQKCILGIGGISLVLFVGVSLVIATGITRPVSTVVGLTEAIAEGDLTQDIPVKSTDEVGQLLAAVNKMKANLMQMIANIKATANTVTSGNQIMSSNSVQISQGASEQAAATEEASSSMEQMVANIRQNADNASQTEKIAIKAAEDARQSEHAVTEAIEAMREIAKKISIIEDITRQTRMLSLNATIEAARAQEYGRGFAVVASEVRALAGRSQTAAIEIIKLTNSSVAIAEKAGDMLKKLVPDIQRTAELVQEISAASKEQNMGAGQIGQAIQQLDLVTQQNSAASEGLSATAKELAEQAQYLQSTIAFFKIDQNHNEMKQKQDKNGGALDYHATLNDSREVGDPQDDAFERW